MSRSDASVEAERWLLQAENDLAFAERGLELGFFAQACFLAQQVAEKAAKAVHYARGARVVMGHSVDGLLAALEADRRAGSSRARPRARHRSIRSEPARPLSAASDEILGGSPCAAGRGRAGWDQWFAGSVAWPMRRASASARRT